MQKNYKLTKLSCYIAIMFQAVSCNIIALLFIPFMSLYEFSYVDLGILVAVNYIVQISVDIIFSMLIDKIAYKKLTLICIAGGFLGFVLLFSVPILFSNVFTGMIVATIVFAASSGLLEVLVSPITNAMPSDHKGASMSFMHSFYALGQVIFITITTLLLFLLKIKNWQFIVLFWTIIPIINFIMFANSKFPENVKKENREKRSNIITKPFFIIAMLAIFFGASGEVVMNQWTSSFMEKALMLPKAIGDLLGMCGFAIALWVGRLLYGLYGQKININKVLIYGSLATSICYVMVAVSPVNFINIIFCVICGFSASLLWPGTLVITSEKFPLSGAWLFAMLAAAGDMGASFGPYVTGFVIDNARSSGLSNFISNLYKITTEQASIRMGLFVAAVFPLIAVACHVYLKNRKNRD